MSVLLRAARLATVLVAPVLLLNPLVALDARQASASSSKNSPAEATPAPKPVATPAVPTVPRDNSPWLFKGSDIPPDPAWTFGTLPNGLRYAVRRNGVPPGQVAIRVAIDAGSLMERENERGFAHLIEHLSFRGSVHVPDGESKRVWQRLGVTFGSDSNAETTFTQTSYKLDLPSATPAGLDESMKILSGMMTGPTLTTESLNAERPVVLAEQREQPGAQVRLGDASRELFFHGQALADHSPIGNVATLEAATAASVQEFHDRWYRPERAVVIVVGDMDPALLEESVIKHFADWKGIGSPVPAPDFGKPNDEGAPTVAVNESALPAIVQYAYVRPWTVDADTVIFNQERWIDFLSLMILNRRLESKARAGGSYISAGASLNDVSRSANITGVSVLPVGNDWEKALADVRATIADAIKTPPSQAEIDREVAGIETQMKNSVATARVEAGAQIADNLVDAIDIRETVAGPEESLKIFQGAIADGLFVPDRIRSATAKLFEGVSRRALVNTPQADPTAPAKLLAALDADVGPLAARTAAAAISFDALPKLGKPATVKATTRVLEGPDIDQIDFSNGAKMLLFANNSETGKIYVQVRFGRGLNALPGDRQTPAWTADLALLASGIGKLGQEELDRMTAGRLISVDFSVDDDAFIMSGVTSPADFKDLLRLIAAKLDKPGWDPKPVERAKAVMLASYEGQRISPDAVLSRNLDQLLHHGDPRWAQPNREQIEATTPASFKKLWAPLLASGPIEVQVFGDVESQVAIDAVAGTIGALKPRTTGKTALAPIAFADPVKTPVILTHDGQPNQAAAVIAWPTGAGSAGITESRKLEILTAIFRDRLLDKLRSEAGLSYTPNVSSQWPVGLSAGGSVVAVGKVPPDKTDIFFDLSRGIATDLATNPVSDDELKRAIVPTLEALSRYSTGNLFWVSLTAGGTIDPARIAAIRTIGVDLGRTSAPEIQALATKYLRPDREWSLEVLPKADTAAAQAAAPTGTR